MSLCVPGFCGQHKEVNTQHRDVFVNTDITGGSIRELGQAVQLARLHCTVYLKQAPVCRQGPVAR